MTEPSNKLMRSHEWTSSKGARTIQFTKMSQDLSQQEIITLKQHCESNSISIAVERRYDRGDGVFMFAASPYAGITLDPSEWSQIQIAMDELSHD